MITLRRKSEAPVRALPIAADAVPPNPDQANRAGFGPEPGATAEILGKNRRKLLIRCGDDLEAAGALAVARLGAQPHIAIDARAFSPAPTPPASPPPAPPSAPGASAASSPAPTPPDPASKKSTSSPRTPPKPAPNGPASNPASKAQPSPATWSSNPATPSPPKASQPASAPSKPTASKSTSSPPPNSSTKASAASSPSAQPAPTPPCLAVLQWPGASPQPPVLFVGKGITFDTGGVCIKPAHGLWEMRADMAGAAACAGALLALALRRSPARAIAVLPLAENAIGAASFRPGDVLRLHAGTTVEIVDTDAEGRIVLADALSYGIGRYHPRAVIDLATLTGSIVTALGHEMAGLFSNDDALAAHLAAAGAAVGERAWRMPLDPRYGDALESDIADIRQCSDGRLQPDACLAAHLLRTFVGPTPWAHLDIAGVESREHASDRHPAGPTGWGARLLDRLISDRFEEPHRS